MKPKSNRARGPKASPHVSIPAPRPAAISLPAGWEKQDFGPIAATDTTVWLDWTKQSKNFVPHVLLAHLKASEGYMRGGSLQAAVQDRLAGLRAGDAKVYTSKPQRVCGGKHPGWFFSYAKLWDDPPLRFDESLFIANGAIYMAVYMHSADQTDDPRTRDALTSLCSGP